MKKQILTLTMCLALTATAALAEGTKTVPQKATPQAKISVQTPAKVPPQKASTATDIKPADQPKIMTREEARKNFEERKAKGRERMYTELGLTSEQKAKAEALDLKTKNKATSLFGVLKAESKKLSDLKSKHASVFAIWKQENKVKASKKALETHFNSSKKAFEELLTPEQKTKFEARRKEMEKFKKAHKGPKGEHGPKHMGPPPEGMGPEQMGPPPEGMGPEGPHGPKPMGPQPEQKK